jgi:hypothetical protein
MPLETFSPDYPRPGLDQADNQQHYNDDKQDMNNVARPRNPDIGPRSKESKQPEKQQDNNNCLNHNFPLFN